MLIRLASVAACAVLTAVVSCGDPVRPSGPLTMDPEHVALDPGASVQLTVRRADAPVPAEQVVFSWSDSSLVVIDAAGRASVPLDVVRSGDVAVTAVRRDDPRDTARTTIAVVPRKVSLAVASTLAPGITQVVGVAVDGWTTPHVDCVSSDTAVVYAGLSFDPGARCVVIGKRAGTATLTARWRDNPEAAATVTVQVLPPATTHIAAPAEVVVPRGDRSTFLVRLYDGNQRSLALVVPEATVGDPTLVQLASREAVLDARLSPSDSAAVAIRLVGANRSGSTTLTLTSGQVTRTITVHVPAGAPDSALVQAPGGVEVAVLANDEAPGSGTTITAVGTPTHGTASVDATRGVVAYTPAAGYFGRDSVQYTARQSSGEQYQEIVRFRVLPGRYVVVPISAQDGPVTVQTINDGGVVAGAITLADGTMLPINWNGAVQRLSRGSLASAVATSVNAAGAAVGFGTGTEKVFLRWQAADAEPVVVKPYLHNAGGPMINDAGYVAMDDLLVALNAGSYRLTGGSSFGYPAAYVRLGDGVVWSSNPRHVGTDLNDRGDVIGYGGFQHLGYAPYLWNVVTREQVALGDLYAGRLATPLRISNAGVIVGTFGTVGAPPPHDLGLFAGGIHASLRELIDPATGSGWVVEQVVDMNHLHQILAYARLNGGARVPVLLTPGGSP